jgi:hypothetical protein
MKGISRNIRVTNDDGDKFSKLPEEIKSFLEIQGADGLWNFWERNDGTYHREYQMGQGADYMVRKLTTPERIELIVERSPK